MTKKSNAPDAVLRKGNLPKAERVVDAKPVIGVARKCVLQQDGGNANPKHRDSSENGIGAKSIADAQVLK